MKKVIFLLVFVVGCIIANAQIPQGFNYQAIIRNSSGNLIQSKTLKVTVAIKTSITGGTVFWEEYHNVTSNYLGLVSFAVGSGTRISGSVAAFNLIDWKAQPLYLKTTVEYPVGTTTDMGTAQILSVPYSLVAKDVEGPIKKLDIKGTEVSLDSALFEVKNKNGQTIFAVYNEGVRIYVDNGAKGAKGGFAVGGFDMAKGTNQTFLAISDDSVKIYIDSNPLTKKPKGGFAVGGYDMAKGTVQNYIDVNADSIRMYIDKSVKSKKGGFAVGSFDMAKGGKDHFLDVATDASGIINPSQNRILWYPMLEKNAFLAGRVLIQHPDSIGVNSVTSGYESRAKGMYSQAMGYKAIARGDYSTAIGKNAIAGKINSFAFGDSARVTGDESYAFGRGAIASGYRSFAFGSGGIDAGGNPIDFVHAKGDYSVAIGQGSQALGNYSMALGIKDTAKGWASVALGYECIAENAGVALGVQSKAYDGFSYGFLSEARDGSVALGQYANATGWYSTAIGENAEATIAYSCVIGPWPLVNGSHTLWQNSDPLFVVGNGYRTMVPVTIHRSSAFIIYKNGNAYLLGNIGIGTTTPGQKLDIIAGSGRVQTGYGWLTNSDARFKKNIYTLTNCIKKVMAMRGVIFDLKSDSLNILTDRKNIGFIAQELENVIPEVVVTGSDGFKSVAYDKITAVLTEAIKEQQQQIESYKSENDNLKSQLQLLQEKVDKIEGLLAKILDE